MSAFTPASEVLLRHSDDFEQSRILFAGDLQDDLPARLDTALSRAHTQQFHHWQVLSQQMGENVRYSLVAEAADVADCDTLIYYWPKNKPEAQFQLMNILSLLPLGTDIFVVGENRSGVRSDRTNAGGLRAARTKSTAHVAAACIMVVWKNRPLLMWQNSGASISSTA
jgi:16S rRNA m(2)G 1207 methyltransferase (EC 2.1.1.52)